MIDPRVFDPPGNPSDYLQHADGSLVYDQDGVPIPAELPPSLPPDNGSAR